MGGLHLTVGSLRQTSRRAGGVDFSRELGLLKAALLYADDVTLISVGGSYMNSMNRMANFSSAEKLALMRPIMSFINPKASELKLANMYRLMDSIAMKTKKNQRLTKKELQMLMYLEEGWGKIRGLVEQTFDDWGADGFRIAQRAGMLQFYSFAATSPEAILRIGLAADEGRLDTKRPVQDLWDDYRAAVLEAVGNKETLPLLDDLSGNVVNVAVRKGIITPSSSDRRRGRHGGLSGNLLQRLPMFERADVSETLDVRKELAEYLGAFRVAVAESAATIEAAAWDTARFAEEADLVFDEKVGPAVDRIEQRVKNDRGLNELTLKYGPSLLSGASSMGAFLGGHDALAGLAALAAGISFVAAGRDSNEKVSRERLYFYYRAGRRIGWVR